MTKEQIDEISQVVARILMQVDVDKVVIIPAWDIRQRANAWVYFNRQRQVWEERTLYSSKEIFVEAVDARTFEFDIIAIGAANCVIIDGEEFRAK